MPRLYRPPIPLEVKLRVVLRQLGEMFPDDVIALARKHRKMARQLNGSLAMLATNLNCDPAELRLDHDPPLGARPRRRRGLGKKTYYVPDANDPDHLLYRPHGPQHEGSHLIKTNVRGDHGQHPDRVLIKKARRVERGPKPKRGPKIKGRGFPSVAAQRKSGERQNAIGYGAPPPRSPYVWSKRPFPKRRKP